MENLFKLARELATPQGWSAGVELARNGRFVEDTPASARSDERTFRIATGPRDKPIVVTLSEESEVWQCSCGSDDDPCRHVVGTILAVRQGAVGSATTRSSQVHAGKVVHSFVRKGDLLEFSRFLAWGEERVEVTSTLLGALHTQEKSGKSCIFSDEELAIDHVLPTKKRGILDPETMRYLCAALSRVDYVELDKEQVRVSKQKVKASVEVCDEEGRGGYRIRRCGLGGAVEVFRNGAALIEGELVCVDDALLSGSEYQMLEGAGTYFSRERAAELATTVLPSLYRKVDVVVRTESLPQARMVAPRVYLETKADESGTELIVVPHLVYGEPPLAELCGEKLELTQSHEVPIRNRAEEARLARDLQQRLHLRVNEAKIFRQEDAIRFRQLLVGWDVVARTQDMFATTESLQPSVFASQAGALSVSFRTHDGQSASLERVLSSYVSGGSFVQLDSGKWGALPKAWLREHEEALRRLCAASAEKEQSPSPAQLLPEVEELCESLGQTIPDYFATLRAGLLRQDDGALPDISLPSDLTVTLRPYQRDGVRWLSLLRSFGLHALLADDMGLGKTLQALCIVKGRTLVIAPASVIHTWRTQANLFRPSLSVDIYHGAKRELANDVDITITTYGTARLDIETLEGIQWDTVILDEAQVIRNPDSLISRAVRRLKAEFKVSLSGTPVENSLSDLWSQFSFLMPGYLGTRQVFNEYSQRIQAGDPEQAARLQRRIKPFLLRRLKRDVAQELPPKTETVLFCDLDHNERVHYEAILGATKSELLEKLSQEQSVFSALEVLLRLRQVCCHTALLPGLGAESTQASSKISLLLERLEVTRSQGHKALIFSQWTSLLDIVQAHLKEREISFSRIDGSTTNREAIVSEFQSPHSPVDVMLLSLKAGGVGLTLTAADHVYILDPWWNPAVEDQAADRVYRIGQENPVFVYRLVARDTVEERVLALQQAKRGLLEAAVGDPLGRVGPLITKDEMLSLLSS